MRRLFIYKILKRGDKFADKKINISKLNPEKYNPRKDLKSGDA